MSLRNKLLEEIRDATAGATPAVTTMLRTRAALGNTVSATGAITPIALVGTGDENLPPPTDGQPTTGGNYNNYVELTGLNFIYQSGEVSVVGHQFVIGANGAGDYRTPHAWLDVSTSANNNVIGFIFGILKASDGLLYFSDRVTGERGSAQDQATNIAGGGFVSGLEPGDKLSVWAAASVTSNLSIYDANLGIEMSIPAVLKV